MTTTRQAISTSSSSTSATASIYGQWRRALDHFDGFKIGLTATPCVMRDARRFRDDEDAQRSATPCDSSKSTVPTYSYGLTEAIADGHLVPYDIYRAMTVEDSGERRRSRSMPDEIDWAALDATTRAELGNGCFAER